MSPEVPSEIAPIERKRLAFRTEMRRKIRFFPRGYAANAPLRARPEGIQSWPRLGGYLVADRRPPEPVSVRRIDDRGNRPGGSNRLDRPHATLVRKSRSKIASRSFAAAS